MSREKKFDKIGDRLSPRISSTMKNPPKMIPPKLQEEVERKPHPPVAAEAKAEVNLKEAVPVPGIGFTSVDKNNKMIRPGVNINKTFFSSSVLVMQIS